MMIFILIFCSAAAILGFFAYWLIFRWQNKNHFSCLGQKGQETAVFKHFQTEGHCVEKELELASPVLSMEAVAVNLMNLSDTPSRLVITTQASDHLFFENPKIEVYPGHSGSSKVRELGFHQGHIHLLQKPGRVKVIYELNFALLWHRAMIVAWVSLLVWSVAELVLCSVIAYFNYQYPEFDLISTYALYGLVFFWVPYWPIRVFNKIAKRSCLMVEQTIWSSQQPEIKNNL